MKVLALFFSWSKQERIGVILLSALLFFMFAADLFMQRLYPFKDHTIHPDSLIVYKKLLADLEKEVNTKVEIAMPKPKEQMTEKDAPKPSIFDPNKLDQVAWQALGFSSKQAVAILKYKKMIGGFKEKEDLAKAYVVSEKKYKEIAAYIQINNSETTLLEEVEVVKPLIDSPPEKLLELNSADSIQLLALKGIGPFYASKIMAYRDELGFFVSIEQLLEIWKFDTMKLAGIRSNLWLDTSRVIKLKINTDSINSLRKHPYLDWNHANAIVNYRSQHGPYMTKEELKKIPIFSDSLLTKLYPYITLDK